MLLVPNAEWRAGEWVLDIWGCSGTVKPARLADYGETFDLPPGWRWAEGKWLNFPVRDDSPPAEASITEAEEYLLDRLEDCGWHLSLDGWYVLDADEMEHLEILLGSDFQNLVNVLELIGSVGRGQ